MRIPPLLMFVASAFSLCGGRVAGAQAGGVDSARSKGGAWRPPGGLPAYQPMSPMSTSRSGLYASSLYEPARGWGLSLSLDYASAAEWERGYGAFVLDAELMRLRLAAHRDITPRTFVTVTAEVNGVFDGVADAGFDWLHEHVLNHRMNGRVNRPRNQFGFHVWLPARDTIRWEQRRLSVGDMRFELGKRLGGRGEHEMRGQAQLSVTLPTSTGPVGYGRDAVSANAIGVMWIPLSDRVAYQASLGVGHTPKRGPLADLARTSFMSASSGLRVRTWRNVSGYLNTIWHSPYYDRSAITELTRSEVAFDFGVIKRSAGGREWRLGFVEDRGQKDPGVDLTMRLGLSW